MRKTNHLHAPFAIIQFCWKELTRIERFNDSLSHPEIHTSEWVGTHYLDLAVSEASEPVTFAEALVIAPTLHLRHTLLT